MLIKPTWQSFHNICTWNHHAYALSVDTVMHVNYVPIQPEKQNALKKSQ